MDRRSSWAKVFSRPAASRNFNEPLSTRNAAARFHRPSLMKLPIPTRRPPPDEEELEVQQVLAGQRPAEPLVWVRQVPGKAGLAARLQVRAVACPQRRLTLVPLSFLRCGSKSTKARLVRSKPSSTGRANSSSVPPASSKPRIRIGKVFF